MIDEKRIKVSRSSSRAPNYIEPDPSHVLYGHSSPITCVAASSEQDICISASYGIVMIHNLRRGDYVRHVITLTPKLSDLPAPTASVIGVEDEAPIIEPNTTANTKTQSFAHTAGEPALADEAELEESNNMTPSTNEDKDTKDKEKKERQFPVNIDMIAIDAHMGNWIAYSKVRRNYFHDNFG